MEGNFQIYLDDAAGASGGGKDDSEQYSKLVQYGLSTGLIEKEDAIYTANRILEALHLDSLEEEAEAAICSYEGGKRELVDSLEEILGEICDFAYEAGLMEENTVGYRDLFDTKMMALLVDRPSNIIKKIPGAVSGIP